MSGLDELLARLHKAAAYAPPPQLLREAAERAAKTTTDKLRAAGVPAKAVVSFVGGKLSVDLITIGPMTRRFGGTKPETLLRKALAEQAELLKLELARDVRRNWEK